MRFASGFHSSPSKTQEPHRDRGDNPDCHTHEKLKWKDVGEPSTNKDRAGCDRAENSGEAADHPGRKERSKQSVRRGSYVRTAAQQQSEAQKKRRCLGDGPPRRIKNCRVAHDGPERHDCEDTLDVRELPSGHLACRTSKFMTSARETEKRRAHWTFRPRRDRPGEAARWRPNWPSIQWRCNRWKVPGRRVASADFALGVRGTENPLSMFASSILRALRGACRSPAPSSFATED